VLEHNYLMYLDVVNHRKGLDSTDNYLRPTIKKVLPIGGSTIMWLP